MVCLLAVRSAILATAWLLVVKLLVKFVWAFEGHWGFVLRPMTTLSCIWHSPIFTLDTLWTKQVNNMAAGRDGDTAVWLHNKLGSTDDLWSGSSICSHLTRERLLSIQECFQHLQPHVKVKLMLSFLHLPKRSVEEVICWTPPKHSNPQITRFRNSAFRRVLLPTEMWD